MCVSKFAFQSHAFSHQYFWLPCASPRLVLLCACCPCYSVLVVPVPLRCMPQRAEMTTGEGKHLPYPPHFRVVPIEIDLGAGTGAATVLGSDLTAEYVHINGDYRS